MIFTKQRQPDDVYEWLVIATRNLVPSARARIWKEIQAHYHESVATHQAEGLTEVDASQMALTELGNVYAAQKEYRRAYLLNSEARRLNRLLERGHFMNLMLGLLLAWLCLGWLSRKESLTTFKAAITAFAVIVFVVIIPTVSTIMSKKQNARKAALWIFLSDSIRGLVTFYCITTYAFSGHPEYPFLIVYFLFLNEIVRTIELMKKIPKDWQSPIPDNIEPAK